MTAAEIYRIAGLCMVASLAIGCAGGGEQATQAKIDDAVAMATVSEAEAATEPIAADNEVLHPDEIYYDLTFFEWYREGRPLIHDGREFQPTSRPESLALAALEPVGRFQGVEFYAMADDSPPYSVLYVPVFEGYWLPFAPVGQVSRDAED
jgi:hypothetical protein